MKAYSIGRDVACDIVISDSTDVISRRHAVLNVTSSGKMTILDQSHNGTYVNGIRISQNVAVPVTRKDNISFAHVARLDWNRIPKQGSALKYVLWSLLGLVVLGGTAWLIIFLNKGEKDIKVTNGGGGVVAADTLRNDSAKKDTTTNSSVENEAKKQKCTSCGRTLPVYDFHWANEKEGRRKSICKDCDTHEVRRPQPVPRQYTPAPRTPVQQNGTPAQKNNNVGKNNVKNNSNDHNNKTNTNEDKKEKEKQGNKKDEEKKKDDKNTNKNDSTSHHRMRG